ncbi:exopolysaccharide biosynthesis polyprenyl glycosylphosphotransferase [Floccifex sp.]|uniref:exopolysaccharide biosynthesis polyprenyl glycosylphosphotransferase n=1 Tax=Floccifex sp. TaxID=2815810 RepID=UPI0029FEC88E|nr:exopolysaccharide biosynthesis polyprenyl glycosylphosphotransferase [Floccifex sp.]MDD7282117.1 exopolysaccharide biosynthesis polyprenyl glycosylphosphotransferase [Erysipelotrichaceae bacterium]MDY2957446.1 exopolysaccharide biosynthesis polyprenyl glycosylphosphotransferase [Floccifex sp.]
MSQDKKKNIIKYTYILITLGIAFFSAVVLWYWNISGEWTEGYHGTLTLVAVGIIYCITYWFFARLYQAQKIGLYRLTELLYFQLLSYGISDAILYIESVFWFHGIDKLDILSYLFTLVMQLLIILVITFICNRLFALYDEPVKIMIIYGDESYQDFLKKLNQKKYRYNVVTCLSDCASIDKIKEEINQCESIYLYDVNKEIRRELILYCYSKEKEVYLTQDIEDLVLRSFDVSHTFDIPFLRTKRVSETWYYRIVKRAFDIVCSLCALIILSPILLIVAFAIKLYDGGPVFYKQVRLTKNHREFEIYKFRSMIVNAESQGARLSSKGDSRITPVGKFIRMTRIDELPQLFNILKGDMSIVGPRPERPEIEEEYLKNLPEFSLRLQVPAGLSGYAQVFGKYNTTPENKLKMDLMYINQRSLLLDLKIILYTIKIIFLPESTEGVDENQITAEKERVVM